MNWGTSEAFSPPGGLVLAQLQDGSRHSVGSHEYPAAEELEVGPEIPPSCANASKGAKVDKRTNDSICTAAPNYMDLYRVMRTRDGWSYVVSMRTTADKGEEGAMSGKKGRKENENEKKIVKTEVPSPPLESFLPT